MATVDVSRIGSNIGALNSLSALTTINNQLAVHQTRLATGKRINSAADDPAGLTIATKLNARSEGLKVALSNIGDAKNLLAVAESGLGRINDILVQMRNKAEQAASDTMGSEERGAIVTQLKAYVSQINDIAGQTTWNGQELINGHYTGATVLTFQTGVEAGEKTTLSDLEDMSATGTNLALATMDSDDSTVSIGSATAGMIVADSELAGLTPNTNLEELKSGTYTIEATSTGVKLFDSTGEELLIAQAANGSGDVGKGLTVDLSDGEVVNFGNGLGVTFGNLGAGTTYSAEIDYVKAGDIAMTFTDENAASQTLSSGSSAQVFNSYMTKLTDAMKSVSEQLSNIGAMSGRLGFKEEQITASQINTEAAYNRIMNANMAEEQVNASKLQILQQTSTAMLAQANAAPQFLLSLFR